VLIIYCRVSTYSGAGGCSVKSEYVLVFSPDVFVELFPALARHDLGLCHVLEFLVETLRMPHRVEKEDKGLGGRGHDFDLTKKGLGWW
jgi:hypothetical protein